MATYTSGSIRFSGLGSDVDFDTMISQLYEIESMHAQQLLSWKSDWEIRRDAFKQVRECLVSMQTAFKTINTTSKFMAKLATSSAPSILGAKAGADAIAGTYTVDTEQLATNSTWSINTGATSTADKVTGATDGVFEYTYKGETRTLNVPSGISYEELKNLINNDAANPGVRAQLITSGGQVYFQISGKDTGQDASLSITDTTGLNGMGISPQTVWVDNGSYYQSVASFSSGSVVLNNSDINKTFVFTANDGSDDIQYTVRLAPGGTLDDLVAEINTVAGGAVTATLVPVAGNQELRLTNGSHTLKSVDYGTLEEFSEMSTATNWQIQRGQDALIRVNGWPTDTWIQCASNTVTDVIDGLTLNLYGEGPATITVSIDTEKMEENVQTFVDAVNEFRTLIKELSAVDENKTVLDPEYAENQSEMQMGSALTGNYGIQLLSSNIKQAVTGSAKGFLYLKEEVDKMYGDVFNSLSQIGIYTDTKEGSDTFGLLVINKESSSAGKTTVDTTLSMTLKEALKKDPEAVAKLFAADNEAKSYSSDIGVNSFIPGITKAGNYSVEYEIKLDSSNNPYIDWAKINGQTVTSINGWQIALYDNSNDAGGLVLDIYNRSVGTWPGAYGTPDLDAYHSVSIRQGKINQILDMMDGTEGILGAEGSLAILENNYDTIIKNINEKITKEDQRLSQWHSRMVKRFSRLEKTLTTYNNLQSMLEQQIQQLQNSGSS